MVENEQSTGEQKRAERMTYCQNCGTQLAEGAKFCPECGQVQGVGKIAPQAASVPPNQAPMPEAVSKKKKRKLPKWGIILAVVVIVACIGCGIVAITSEPTDESKATMTVNAGARETEQAAPTATPGPPTNTPGPTNTPTPVPFTARETEQAAPTATPGPPTNTPGPTNTPTPVPFTARDIERKLDELTDLQWDKYTVSVIGEEIHFSGKVLEVYDDTRVQISFASTKKIMTGGMLHGFSVEQALELNQDQTVSGVGTIREVGAGLLGLTIHIDVTTVE